MPRAKSSNAADFLPQTHTLEALREAAQDCRACDLHQHATQAVFGEGPVRSRLLLIGEQPGNDEDLKGHPFVGPAGKLLDRELEEAGIPRSDVFVTTVVKHFKFEERGTRLIHEKPSASEVQACRPWPEAEIAAVTPRVIVCLGATAAQSILGREFRLTQSHGEFFEHPWAKYVSATLHPSAILRAPDDEERHRQFRQLVQKRQQTLARSVPGYGWVGFDPTNNLFACKRHIRTAIGRDYADVPPTKGVQGQRRKRTLRFCKSRSDRCPTAAGEGSALFRGNGQPQSRSRSRQRKTTSTPSSNSGNKGWGRAI